jgi:magnesium-transporting ATPase (P-type)
MAVASAFRIRMIMITGDHSRTALRIATDLGIVVPGRAGAGKAPRR